MNIQGTVLGDNFTFQRSKDLPVQFSSSAVSDSLGHHGPQYTRLPCPSPTPEACSDACPLSRLCHPTIWSSVVPYCTLVNSCKYWVGQKVHLGFPQHLTEESKKNFLANPIYSFAHSTRVYWVPSTYHMLFRCWRYSSKFNISPSPIVLILEWVRQTTNKRENL